MPREARRLKALKSYHVMVQGINKEHIFKDEQSKQKYLFILKKQLNFYGIKLIAYCIMINHAHLLLYSEDSYSISDLMHMVNGMYSQYYNERMARVGFVFRDRFLSQEIFDYNQFKVCIAYIHNNPVKANIVKSPDKYPFSSYNDYRKGYSGLIDFDLIRFLFKDDDPSDIWNYLEDSKFKLKEFEYYDKETFYSDVVRKIDIMKVLKDKEILKRFLIACKDNYFVPYKELSEILNVSKTTICKWYREIEEGEFV